MQSATTPVYVLWFGPTGLSVARALGRLGIRVIGVHHDVNEPCVDTRYARVQILPPLSKGDGPLLDYLISEGRNLAPSKGVLIAASDAHWLFTARHRAVLDQYFNMAMPRHGAAEDWVGKPAQYAAASRAGVLFPRTFTVRTSADLDDAASQADFPCLVKPVLSHLWQREYGSKLSYARTPDDLRARGDDALSRGLDIMVQEYIPAADNEIYCHHTYIDRSGRAIANAVVRKLRQHEPRFGNSSISQCVDKPRVMDLSLRLLREMGYHGIGSVEFKLDPRDGEFKLMELNVRPTLLMALSADSGVNMPLMLYRDMCGEAPPPQPITPTRFGRRVGILANDIRSARFYHKYDGLSYVKWLWSWVGTRDLYFAWDDLAPFRGYLHTFIDHLRRGKYRGFPENFPSPELWAETKWDGATTAASATGSRAASLTSAPSSHVA